MRPPVCRAGAVAAIRLQDKRAWRPATCATFEHRPRNATIARTDDPAAVRQKEWCRFEDLTQAGTVARRVGVAAVGQKESGAQKRTGLQSAHHIESQRQFMSPTAACVPAVWPDFKGQIALAQNDLSSTANIYKRE